MTIHTERRKNPLPFKKDDLPRSMVVREDIVYCGDCEATILEHFTLFQWSGHPENAMRRVYGDR
jgi:hypothetical protein